MKLINFFLVKKAYYVKRQDFFKKNFKTVHFMIWIRSRSRNRNLSKIGTGPTTVTTLVILSYFYINRPATLKQVGGGSWEASSAAAGGRGNPPPGTINSPGRQFT
jgi:hypothetical protein